MKHTGTMPRRLRAGFARMGYAARKGTPIRACDVARAAAAARAGCCGGDQSENIQYIVIPAIASSPPSRPPGDWTRRPTIHANDGDLEAGAALLLGELMATARPSPGALPGIAYPTDDHLSEAAGKAVLAAAERRHRRGQHDGTSEDHYGYDSKTHLALHGTNRELGGENAVDSFAIPSTRSGSASRRDWPPQNGPPQFETNEMSEQQAPHGTNRELDGEKVVDSFVIPSTRSGSASRRDWPPPNGPPKNEMEATTVADWAFRATDRDPGHRSLEPEPAPAPVRGFLRGARRPGGQTV